LNEGHWVAEALSDKNSKKRRFKLKSFLFEARDADSFKLFVISTQWLQTFLET